MKFTQKDLDELKKLLVLAQSGERGPYERFLLKVTPYVRTIVQKVFINDDRADVVQEVLLSIHKSLGSYDSKRPVLPWVSALANRRVVDYIRKTTSKKQLDEMLKDQNVTNQQLDTKPFEEESLCLDSLPETTKRAILLTKVEGHSTEEAAQIIGIGPNALRTRVSRGIKKLRKSLGVN